LLQALDVMQPIDRAVLPAGEILYEAHDQALPISPTVQSLSVIRAHLLPLRASGVICVRRKLDLPIPVMGSAFAPIRASI
jgi:hypothetical protein